MIQLDPKTYRHDGSLVKIKEERGYTFEDEIDISPLKLEDYKQQVPDLSWPIKTYNAQLDFFGP